MTRAAVLKCAVAALALAWMMPAAAAAQVCAARKIAATGETAQFAVLGRVSARTAWGAKVSRDPRLGSAYSTWFRSKERRLVCRKVDRRHVCLAVALPCRLAGGLAGPSPAAALPIKKQRPL